MSILTYINGVPLYSTINEALEWAKFKGIFNYHTHKYESVTGYMRGKNHNESSAYPGDMPTKEKIEARIGYIPKLGSKVVSVVNGKQSEFVATRDVGRTIRKIGNY